MKRILSILSVATLFVLIGCTDSNDDMEIVYDSIIEPDFTVAAAEIVAGVTPVTFTNTTSVEGTTVAEYFWHFGFSGEGNWSEEAEPDPIVYNQAGEYTVTLTAWGADGNRATTTRTITVLADNVLPTAGTVNADGTFSASALTNSLTVETDRKEFTVGLLPVGVASKMSVHVTTTDGMTYSDKSFQLAGLKRNTHYTMNVPCRTKRFMLTVPDGVNSKYGTGTYGDNGFFQVEPQYDPESIFDGWHFLRSEIKSDKDAADGDVLKNRNRIQLQAVSLGTNRAQNGAFVTPPIQCDGTKTVTVSFTAATNKLTVGSVQYRIGVTNNGADISENFLRSFDNIQSSLEGECPWKHSGSVSRTHTFTVTNGQRIMMKVYSSGGGTPCHLELADFTYTVE